MTGLLAVENGLRSGARRWAMVVFIACLVPVTAVAQEPVSAVGPLMKLYQSGKLPAERQPAVVEMICNRGNEHDLRVVFDQLLAADGMTPALRLKAMGWLGDAVQTRKVRPAGDLSALAQLAQVPDPALRLGAIRLAGTLQVASISPVLQQLAGDPQSPPELRRTAISGLLALGGEANQRALRNLAVNSPGLETRLQAIAALTGLDLSTAAEQGAVLLASASPQVETGPMLDAFFDRKEGSVKLAWALEQLEKQTPPRKPSVDTAKRALRHMYLVGRNDPELSQVLSAAAGVASDPVPPGPEEVAELARDALAKGDPSRGEQIFRRKDVGCMGCHAVNRAGGQVGPELSAVGGSSPIDYVVNSILNPNLAVKEQYVTRIFELSTGKVAIGVVIDRDETRVRLKDAQGKIQSIPTADIEEEVEGKSLMPLGPTKFLTRDELLDLIRFIAELGKPGPFAVSTAPTIQRWQWFQEPPAELTGDVPHLEHIRELVLGSPPEVWASVYGQVSGFLPLNELRKSDPPKVVLLRGELQVNEAGPVGVQVETPAKVQVWVNAQAFEAQKSFTVPLEPGRHFVIIRAELPSTGHAGLKVLFHRPEGSSAQFEVIGGA